MPWMSFMFAHAHIYFYYCAQGCLHFNCSLSAFKRFLNFAVGVFVFVLMPGAVPRRRASSIGQVIKSWQKVKVQGLKLVILRRQQVYEKEKL